MSPARQQNPVAIDTNVFGAELLPRTAALAAAYEPFLTGRPAFISFVTVAELWYGARRAGWGEARRRTLDARIAHAEIVWPGPELTSTYVDLRAQCASRGQGLSQRIHEADRWVAATAIWLGTPLVTHDRVFHDVPGLELPTTLK